MIVEIIISECSPLKYVRFASILPLKNLPFNPSSIYSASSGKYGSGIACSFGFEPPDFVAEVQLK